MSVKKYAAEKLLKLGTVGAVTTAGIGVKEFMDNKKEGAGTVESVATAAMKTAAVGIIGPGKYLAGIGLVAAPRKIEETYQKIDRRSRELGMMGSPRPFQGNTFVDNKQVFTMRQSAVAVMQQSKYNLEHAMQGTEATFLHR